jgi:periplasmic copper chaperone A
VSSRVVSSGALFAAVALIATGPAVSPAVAHVVLSQARAPAGSYYTAYLRVGHGCAGRATTSLRVEVPPETPVVRAQPKPGWTLRIEHLPLAEPIANEGRTVTERVAAITWTGGPLPDAEWDEFGVSLKLPTRTGPFYLPVVQTCEVGEERWTDRPSPGAKAAHPAPKVMLEPPAAGGEDMAGMRMGG